MTFNILLNFSALLQQVDMGSLFYESGKIYVVVAVALIILVGILLYLFNMERRLAKLEKEKK